MKKVILLSLVLLGGGAMYAQNVVPTNGSVGLAVEQPEEQLHVNGNIKTDSCVIVQDSIIVGKNARIGADMKVAGFLYVNENITGNKDLEITKNATIGKNLTVDKKIIAPNTPELEEIGNKKILVMGNNGVVKKIPIDAVLEDPYVQKDCGYDVNGNPIIVSPVWNNGEEKIFTGTANCTGTVKVGIGEDNPTARLEIKAPTNIIDDAIIVKNQDRKIFQVKSDGLVRAREIKVDAVAWPDYVFEKEYVLMPLDKVEEFINKEGHLPNVPSAKEVETNGQNLGDMNKILMEKVEELTLHLIRQQKEIDALKKQVIDNSTKSSK